MTLLAGVEPDRDRPIKAGVLDKPAESRLLESGEMQNVRPLFWLQRGSAFDRKLQWRATENAKAKSESRKDSEN